jgi:hypothetical protein
MQRLFPFLLFSLISINLLSQSLENIGAGFLDFMTRNPKTANKMKPEQAIALDIISDLLKTEGQRKHELKYASAGRNQITVNTSNGGQVQFVRDDQGNIYFLSNGIVYRVSDDLKNQAIGINPKPNVDNSPKDPKNNTIDYNKIKGEYYTSPRRKSYVRCIIPYKWSKDLNQDNVLSLDERKHIKGIFYDNENFYIDVIGEYVDSDLQQIIKLINDYTGEEIHLNSGPIGVRDGEEYSDLSVKYEIGSGEIPPGTYLIYVTLTNKKTGKVISTKSETITIKAGNDDTKEVNYWEKRYLEKVYCKHSPQGIFFYTIIMEDGNSCYSNNEFRALNLNTYSLSEHQVIHFGINFPNESGGVIINVYGPDKNLIYTKTNEYQRHDNSIIYRSKFYHNDFIIVNPGVYTVKISFIEGNTYESYFTVSK